LDKPKDVFATIEPLKNFVAFVLSAHYVHGELFAVVCGHGDEEEIDCNQLKKVRPTSTNLFNVSWKNRHEIILVSFLSEIIFLKLRLPVKRADHLICASPQSEQTSNSNCSDSAGGGGLLNKA